MEKEKNKQTKILNNLRGCDFFFNLSEIWSCRSTNQTKIKWQMGASRQIGAGGQSQVQLDVGKKNSE